MVSRVLVSPAAAVSVIVVNWNGGAMLDACLMALAGQSYSDFEIVLVDNGSTDGSVELVRKKHPTVRIVELVENAGFARANNIGIAQAAGRYIALLNNDTELEANWLLELVTALEMNPSVSFCASKMLLKSDPRLADACGDFYTTEGVPGKIGHQQRADLYNDPRQVFGACAGAAIYRRSMLEELGGFDEDFFIVHEDSDLSFRAQLMGYKCLYVPTAVVYHHLGGTLGQASDLAVYYAQRNSELVYLKNMPLSLLVKYLPWHVLMNFLRLLSYAKRRQMRTFLRAKFGALRLLPKTLAKRRAVQRARRVSAEEIDKLLVKGWLVGKIRSRVLQRRQIPPSLVG